ncbi:hypothetical protein [Rhodoferax sp.]|uniref:hypothetical protein n=1 Tax=Rhodoferax sp. TaxID=50421 RepID=UPI0027316955|nr:hypothetical protein [Rhodoferax sp.]MDZ4208463.1 hypothetical protein [Rhodoferax sp.]
MNKQNNFSSLGVEYPNRGSWRQAHPASRVASTAASCPAASRATPFANTLTIDPNVLFPRHTVITVIGRIEDWTLAWAGRIHCTLCLSIGDVPLRANRDSLPIEIQNGHWVRAKLMLRRGSSDPSGISTLLLSSSLIRPRQSNPTAWTPTVPFHRFAHMRRLYRLLSQLAPGQQAIFMAVMADSRIQQGFFLRIAATDHHTYPGGLFDCSIEAAELTLRQEHLGTKERGLMALVCLLFDLGKLTDERYEPDQMRCHLGLAPHPGTVRLIDLALDAVARFEPDLFVAMHQLLGPCDWTEWLSPPGIAPTLKQHIHQAIQQAWHIDPAIASSQDDSTPTGEQK